MPAKSTKLITYLLLGALLGAILCILGCIGLVALNTIAGDSGQPPIRSLRVTIDESQREEFFDQLRKFADQHGFEISIRDSGLSNELFVVDMRRDDIEIISRNPFDPRIFRISFYDKYPGHPVNEETADELLNDLKSFIGEIPNITITEEK